MSARLLLGALAGRSQLVASPLLLAELADVLRRPKFRRYLSIEDAHLFVSTIRELAVIVDDPPEEDDPITGDPDDDFLVLLAEVAGADVLWSDPPRMDHLECERTDHNRYGRKSHERKKAHPGTGDHKTR